MERHVGGAPPPHHRGRPFSGTETAHANEYFEHFLNAATLKNILGYHRYLFVFFLLFIVFLFFLFSIFLFF